MSLKMRESVRVRMRVGSPLLVDISVGLRSSEWGAARAARICVAFGGERT